MVQKALWRVETEKYIDRLENLIKPGYEPGKTIKEIYADINLFGKQLGQNIASKLVTYAMTNYDVALNVIEAVINQWKSGLFVIVSLNIRYVFETWGAIHFAKGVLENLIKGGDIEKERKRTDRLTFGSRSEVHLPFGGVALEKSFNVMDFIRGLKDVLHDADKIYDFLSEASHPNEFQNLYFLMAGPQRSNWSNKGFSKHMHNLLDKTLKALEDAKNGMDNDLKSILTDAKSFIENY